MLGETFELIQPKYRFFAEQVSHHPPISAYHFQGEGYEGHGHSECKQSFKFGAGTGNLILKQEGRVSIKFKKHLETMSIPKPTITISNIVLG